jgi:hypothetical protein
MAEYSRIAKGHFTSTGAAKAINLPFQPDAVEFWNFSANGTPAQNGVPYAYWDVQMGQGTAVANYFNATPVLSSGNVTANGISTFSAGLALQYGAKKQIIGITKADPASVNVTAHGYSTGDVVLFYGLYSTQFTAGMPQLDGIPFVVTVVDADNFTIPWNTNQSNYTALTGSPAGAFVRKVLYPYLYSPGVSVITSLTLSSSPTNPNSTIVNTTTAHNLVVGQEVAFRIPELWGTIELNSLPNVYLPGSPIYGYVVEVTDANTVVVNINSYGYTAFDSNIAVADVPGLTPAQLVAVGDVNTGGELISLGSPLYPSPLVDGVRTINGPAIRGAFVNNTRQGFVIGAGALTGLASTVLVGANGNVIYWRAYLSDIALP